MSERMMHFFGVKTAGSLSHALFQRWADVFGVPDARLEGVDLPLNASRERYRAAVERLKSDPDVAGALITSHKVNVVREAGDLIDRLTVEARLCGEVSALYKRYGVLWGHACDPANSGEAMRHFLGADWWRRHPRAAILAFGAGGATVAMMVHLLAQARSSPRRIVVIDIRKESLDHCRAAVDQLCPAGVHVGYVLSDNPAVNQAILRDMPPHSLVINATGMGKDLPGSPVTDAVSFPRNGIAWDLNYRGERLFLQQARRQAADRGLRVVDGWHYFLRGWSSVMSCVFDVPITDGLFAEFSAVSADARPAS